MRFSGTAVYIDFLKELAYNTKTEFEKVCFEVLIDLYPNLKRSETLGLYDKSGFDLFTVSTVGEVPELLFQCKGFQEEFEKSQFNQCIKSIQSFKKTGLVAGAYYFIINKKIKANKYYEDLNLELEKLKKENRIKQYHVFDIDDFLGFLYKQYALCIKSAAEKSSRYFYEQYASSLGESFYINDVPFNVNVTELNNPVEYIMQRGTNQYEEGRLEKSKYLFVISEFGFGKTTLLFELYNRLFLKKKIPLFVPIGALPPDAYASEGNVTRSILALIQESNLENTQANKFKRGVFSNILKNDGDIVLLFDGMDEHKYFRTITGLKIFFNSITSLKPLMVFTMRKEFWDERQVDIQNSVGKTKRVQDKLTLVDWTNKEMSEFVSAYIKEKKSSLTSTGQTNLFDFQKAIEADNYHERYGDIPKRPLFLRMIAEDEALGFDEQNIYSISSLYKKYVVQKLTRDLAGSFGSFIPDRGLEIQDGTMEFARKIFKILEETASKMYAIEGNNLIPENRISSSEIDLISKDYGVTDILNLLLHSVLVSEQERRGFDFNLKFAHFSFLEYFLARYIVGQLKNDNQWLDYDYDFSMLQFLESLLKEPENKALMDRVLKYQNKSVLAWYLNHDNRVKLFHESQELT